MGIDFTIENNCLKSITDSSRRNIEMELNQENFISKLSLLTNKGKEVPLELEKWDVKKLKSFGIQAIKFGGI